MALNYEIADMCKKCMKAHIKKKGSFMNQLEQKLEQDFGIVFSQKNR